MAEQTDQPPPPEGSTLTPTPDDQPIGGPTREEGQAAANELNAEYAADAAALDDIARYVVREWQGADRTYESFQRAVRGDEPDLDWVENADYLDQLIDRHPLRRPVRAFRGVRDSRKVFGVDSSELNSLIGRRWPLRGYFGTTVFRGVARDEFTRPPHGGGPILFDLHIPAGIRALWVALVGDDDLAYQGELLLPAYVSIMITSVDYSGDIPVVQATVEMP